MVSELNDTRPNPERLEDAFRRSAKATHMAEKCHRYLMDIARGEELPDPRQFDAGFLRSEGKTVEHEFFEYANGTRTHPDLTDIASGNSKPPISVGEKYSSWYLSFFSPFFNYSEILEEDYVGISEYVDEDSTLPSWMAILEWEKGNHYFSVFAREGKDHISCCKDLFNTHRIFDDGRKDILDITDTYAFEESLFDEISVGPSRGRFLPSAVIVKNGNSVLDEWEDKCEDEGFHFNKIILSESKAKEIDEWIRKEYKNGVSPSELPAKVARGESGPNAQDLFVSGSRQPGEYDGLILSGHQWYRKRVKEEDNGLQGMLAYLLWLRSLSIPKDATLQEYSEINNFRAYLYFPFFNLAEEYVNSVTMGFPGWPDPVLLKSIQETADKAFQRSAVRQAERSREAGEKEGQVKAAIVSGHEAGPQLTTAQACLPDPDDKMTQRAYNLIDRSLKYAHLFLNETSDHIQEDWLPWRKGSRHGKRLDEWIKQTLDIGWQIAVARAARNITDPEQYADEIDYLLQEGPHKTRIYTPDDLIRFSPTGAEDTFSFDLLRWALAACSNAFKWSEPPDAVIDTHHGDSESIDDQKHQLNNWAKKLKYFSLVGVAVESGYRIENEEITPDEADNTAVLSVFNGCREELLPDSPNEYDGTLGVLNRIGTSMECAVDPLSKLDNGSRLKVRGKTTAVSRIELPKNIFE